MKNAIWKKILFFTVIPFLLVFVLSSFTIINTVVRDKTRQAEMDARNLAKFNEANFLGLMDSVRISVTTSASELEKIDPSAPEARKLGENIVISMLENRHVFNAWLAYEPNGFDGRDGEHRGDYPGAPSGRYMRSFNRGEGGFVQAPDMNETTLDDPRISNWYTQPRDSGTLFIDTSDETLYDYGTGEGALSVLSISTPIFRGDEVIGCAGADILFSQLVLGPEIFPGAASATFSPKNKVIFANDAALIGKEIDELGFSKPYAIKKAFGDAEELFLVGERSPFLNEKAFIYFKPVIIFGLEELVYLCAAIPANSVTRAVYPVLAPIAASLSVALIVFSALIAYIRRYVSTPIHNLTLAADAISRGDLDTEIASPRSSDEIGMMTGSLRRMAEQFRIYLVLLERSRDLLNLYMLLNRAAYQNDDVKKTFDSMASVICTFFGVNKASLVFIVSGRAKIISLFEASSGIDNDYGWNSPDFESHGRITEMLAGKKYIFLNSHAISAQKIDFLDPDAASACILPIITGDIPRGYFILERKHVPGAFIHDDKSLVFIAETLSYILSQKEAYSRDVKDPHKFDRRSAAQASDEAEGDLQKDGEPPALMKARKIDGLDVDKGIMFIGGARERYLELLRLSQKTLGTAIEKMRKFLRSDLRAFAIEVHGVKGALYNIGANSLAKTAEELETSAREQNADYCEESFPDFERMTMALIEALDSALSVGALSKGPGNAELLLDGLLKARRSCEKYDAFAASDILTPLAHFDYDAANPGAGALLAEIIDSLDAVDYDKALDKIGELIGMLRGGFK